MGKRRTEKKVGDICPRQFWRLDPAVEEGMDKGKRARRRAWVPASLQALSFFHFKHWLHCKTGARLRIDLYITVIEVLVTTVDADMVL